MLDVVNECIKHFGANRAGPVRYLSCFQDYYYILDGTAHQDLLTFFAQDPPPYLKVGTIGSSKEFSYVAK